MLDAAREAAHMAQGKTRADLDADRPLNLSQIVTQDLPSLIAELEKIRLSGPQP